MNKRIENLVKRVEKNNGKSVTLRRDVLVKMAQEQLFDYMDSYSYDDMFGVSEGKGIKGDFTESCEDVRRSSVGFCSVRIVDNKLKFYCHIHSNSSFNLYIELNEDQKESKEVEISEDVKVELNEEKNGVEIYFSSKPSEEVRNNLKANGFRWSKYNKCWYTKQSENTLNFANSLLPKKDDKINDLLSNEVSATEEIKESNKNMEVENMSNNLYIDIEQFKNDNKIHDIKEYTVYTAPQGIPTQGQCKRFYDNDNNFINVTYNKLSRFKMFTIDQYNVLLRLQAAAEKQRSSGFSSRHKEIYNNLLKKIDSVYNGSYNIKDCTLESIAAVGGVVPSINKNGKDELINKNNIINNKQIQDIVKDFKCLLNNTDDKITISSLQNDSLDVNLQLLANDKTSNNDIKIDCKEVLKETEDYILFKKGNVYVLRHFDECFYHEKYDRNKKIAQSRITKHYDNIKHLLE